MSDSRRILHIIHETYTVILGSWFNKIERFYEQIIHETTYNLLGSLGFQIKLDGLENGKDSLSNTTNYIVSEDSVITSYQSTKRSEYKQTVLIVEMTFEGH